MQSKASHDSYGNIAELRSFSPNVMVAMTATATKEAQDFIIENLSPLMIVGDPQKFNIMYNLLKLNHKDISVIFKDILDDLIKNSYAAR